MRITGRDEIGRDIAVTAFPLLVGPDEFAGAVAIFWEHSEDRPEGLADPGDASSRNDGD
jgi:hypothetical protein